MNKNAFPHFSSLAASPTCFRAFATRGGGLLTEQFAAALAPAARKGGTWGACFAQGWPSELRLGPTQSGNPRNLP